MVKEFFHKLNDNLFVFGCKNLEDFRSVLSAKTSRTLMLEEKKIDQEEIERFLKTNIFNYNHASIGDMGFATVFHRGFGWLTSRVLLDDPLFNGQETSSRAVNILNYWPDICYDADKKFTFSHEKFKNIFNELTKNTNKTNYSFDSIRWSLPGTLCNGIVVSMNIRAFSRKLDYIKQDFPITAHEYLKGLKFIAPYLTEALYGKNRQIPSRYTKISTFNIDTLFDNYDKMIHIKPPKNFNSNNIFINDFDMRLKDTKNMLDSRLNRLGLFELTIFCSIAEARDWFRHRTALPWDIYVLTINNKPFVNTFFESYGLYKNEVEKYMSDYNLEKTNHISELYGLPYGSMLKIRCFVPLNYLVYILELRANSHGSNIEYSSKAKIGLAQLREILGEHITNYFGI